jgi:hypothetical protein
MAQQAAAKPRSYPLYGSTFTTHRLSPLYLNRTTLNNATLRIYASQFRDILTGEVLRGVRVGLAADDEAQLARVGALKTVQWTLLKDEFDWEEAQNMDPAAVDETALLNDTIHTGILVEVIYEKATYSAILLRNEDQSNQAAIPGFSLYPLLLTRMQSSLRETFIDYLATTFDTRASVLKLPSTYIADSLETYLFDVTTTENGPMDAVTAHRSLRTVVKDVLITLSFDVPGMTSSLKTMDITISKEDTQRMLARGEQLLDQPPPETETGQISSNRPFITALKQYVSQHLALHLDNPAVKISRIACGAFVLGTEGKLKLSSPPTVDMGEDVQRKATDSLVASLVELARGKKMGVVDLT